MIGQEAAETAALRVLAWLMGDDEARDGFLGASGAAPGDLAALAGEPAFLGAVLDFVLERDAWVVEAAAAAGLAPERMAEVRAALPGGAVPDWT